MKKLYLFLFLLILSTTASAVPDYKKWGNLTKGSIESISKYYLSPEKFDSITQSLEINANKLNKKTVYLTANIKAKITNPKGWAGLWIRLENKRGETIGFSNMENRPIKGTRGSWRSYSNSLYIPKETTSIVYGILLSGNGKVEIDQGKISFNAQ